MIYDNIISRTIQKFSNPLHLNFVYLTVEKATRKEPVKFGLSAFIELSAVRSSQKRNSLIAYVRSYFAVLITNFYTFRCIPLYNTDYFRVRYNFFVSALSLNSAGI